jgi:hypothetical protein
MRTSLKDLIGQHQETLTTHVVDRLRSGDLVHYGQVDPPLLRERVGRLVAAFLDSLAGEPAIFVDFVGQLAEERLAEGYFLDEIQAGLNLLDERSCDIVMRRADEGRIDDDLLRICRTVSLAKDALARTYFRRKEEAEARLAALGEPR